MSTIKLACPTCGHDGTAATGRSPFGSHGFNYLAEGIVCREVWGYDQAGGLRLSPTIDCVRTQEAGAKIECRSCWRTFPAPAGLVRTLAPDRDAPEPARQRAALGLPQPSL